MKLIIEEIEDFEYLTEGENGKNLYISGIFLAGEVKNKNGRIYPMHVLEPEAERYIRESVATGSGWGELTHPQSPTINPDRISHRTVSLVREGNNYVGKALVITENPSGAIVRGLINSGGKVGVSSRGLGSLKKNSQGLMEVQKDYRIATCADVVLNPSGPGCWVNGIMEGVEFAVTEDGRYVQEETRRELRKMSLSQISEQRVQMFEKFVKNLVKQSKR
jgi:hypothetical protein